MAKLVFGMNQSLDGYVDHMAFAPSPTEVRRHVNSATTTAIRAIEWYQRVISPRKGFSCAYRAAWGGHSCSGAVKSAFVDGGVIGGIGALFEQPFKCHGAARVLADRGPFRGSSEEHATGSVLFCCFLPF
jgi:putative component of membrane protein insertase Oxa1/YidC/SpoIIIJ protein YidD